MKLTRSEIPRKTVYRLSAYLRCLTTLKHSRMRMVSSEALAKAAGVKPTQVRKDLAYFGQFGTRGIGYDVEQLSRLVSDLLGTNSLRSVILVGVGNLGLALLSYRGFQQEGFEIIAAFDKQVEPRLDRSGGPPIYPIEELPEIVRQREVRMAILTVPGSAAQKVTNHLVECGITGILNFAPAVLEVPEHVMVNDVNLAFELENLCYYLRQ